jgi:hypothetical protein
MDREKLSKGNELIEQHERYGKLASMLNMLIDYDNNSELTTTGFKLAITDAKGVCKEQTLCDEDVPLIKDLLKVVRSYDEKVMKEFEEL